MFKLKTEIIMIYLYQVNILKDYSIFFLGNQISEQNKSSPVTKLQKGT